MNILNKNFEKSISKKDNIYFLEIKLSSKNINDFIYKYKIYGEKEFINSGIIEINKNKNISHIIIVQFEELEKIFFNVTILNNKNEKKEYYEFIDLFELSNSINLKKNINICIKKKIKNDEFTSDNNIKFSDSDSDSNSDSSVSSSSVSSSSVSSSSEESEEDDKEKSEENETEEDI
jgi:hypothetical protein